MLTLTKLDSNVDRVTCLTLGRVMSESIDFFYRNGAEIFFEWYVTTKN